MSVSAATAVSTVPAASRSVIHPASRALGAGVSAGLVALALANGGYFPEAWGFASVGLIWTALLALLLSPSAALSRLEGVTLGAIAGVAGWSALSALWSSSGLASLTEVQRTLVYLAGLGALLLLVREHIAVVLVGALHAAATMIAAYALATRLFPERFHDFDPVAGYRLAEPLGYWNALGILCTLGILLAGALAARAQRTAVRVVACASLVVLAPALYFTFSRGAWIALAVGLLATLVLDSRRLQLLTMLLVALPAPAAAVWLSSRSEALTRQQASLADASHDGHRLALAILVLAAVAAAATAAASALERRLSPGLTVRRVYAGSWLLAAGAALATTFALFGGPPALARHAADSFRQPPPQTEGDLNVRLFSLSGNGRARQWAVAWEDAADHPWLGSGAGTYERYWLANRPVAGKVRDAHSLYLETLAETGPVGLGILVLALGAPLFATVRARRRPLVAAAAGGYVAFLVHAGADWDWEMPALTLGAFTLAAFILAAARGEQPPPPLSGRVRAALAATCVALGAFALTGLLGHGALASSAAAARDGDFDSAAHHAHAAARWLPWSAEPWQQLGQVQLAAGEIDAARASFRRALASDPGNWELWFDLARTSDGMDQLAALAEASRLNPLSPEVAELRAELAEGA